MFTAAEFPKLTETFFREVGDIIQRVPSPTAAWYAVRFAVTQARQYGVRQVVAEELAVFIFRKVAAAVDIPNVPEEDEKKLDAMLEEWVRAAVRLLIAA